MRAICIRLALSAALFLSAIAALSTTSHEAHAFGRGPIRLVPPAEVRVLGLQNNQLYLHYLHLPDLLRGLRNPVYTVELVSQHGEGFRAAVARIGCGSGFTVVKLPSHMPPDHYRVALRNSYGETLATSSQSFYFVPTLGSDERSRLVFDTYGGTGPFDRMTYYQFESSTIIEATGHASFRQLVPAVWYCNGACWVDGVIHGRDGRVLAQFSQRTWAAGDGFGPPVTLKNRLHLRRGEHVRVSLRVRTTMSVGIVTSGTQTKWRKIGNFSYFLQSSTHLDRGGIRFRLVDMR